MAPDILLCMEMVDRPTGIVFGRYGLDDVGKEEARRDREVAKYLARNHAKHGAAHRSIRYVRSFAKQLGRRGRKQFANQLFRRQLDRLKAEEGTDYDIAVMRAFRGQPERQAEYDIGRRERDLGRRLTDAERNAALNKFGLGAPPRDDHPPRRPRAPEPESDSDSDKDGDGGGGGGGEVEELSGEEEGAEEVGEDWRAAAIAAIGDSNEERRDMTLAALVGRYNLPLDVPDLERGQVVMRSTGSPFPFAYRNGRLTQLYYGRPFTAEKIAELRGHRSGRRVVYPGRTPRVPVGAAAAAPSPPREPLPALSGRWGWRPPSAPVAPPQPGRGTSASSAAAAPRPRRR